MPAPVPLPQPGSDVGSGRPSTPGPRDTADRADEPASRRQDRQQASAIHAQALDRRRRAETARACALIADFLPAVQQRGIAPSPLRARSYDRRHRYRTGLRGWYLRRDEGVAVGTDGGFYVLTVPSSLRAALRGAQVPPADPPLVLGAGGRDGESIGLDVALARVLEGHG